MLITIYPLSSYDHRVTACRLLTYPGPHSRPVGALGCHSSAQALAHEDMERDPWWKNVDGPFPEWPGPVGVKPDGGGCHRASGTVGKMVVHRAVHNHDADGAPTTGHTATQGVVAAEHASRRGCWRLPSAPMRRCIYLRGGGTHGDLRRPLVAATLSLCRPGLLRYTFVMNLVACSARVPTKSFSLSANVASACAHVTSTPPGSAARHRQPACAIAQRCARRWRPARA